MVNGYRLSIKEVLDHFPIRKMNRIWMKTCSKLSETGPMGKGRRHMSRGVPIHEDDTASDILLLVIQSRIESLLVNTVLHSLRN